MVIRSTPLIAQEKSIKGELVNTRSEEKIAGATILIKSLGLSAISGNDGYFTINVPQNKECELEISAINYKKKAIRLSPSSYRVRINMEQTATTMEEVVVSSTQKEVKRTESPIPVETYSSKFFKKNVTPCFFEALSVVNGVQPQLNCNVCNAGDIHINGMAGPYTMVLIDGMPIVSQLASVYGFSGIPTSLIKRVEIVKGPASTLYGSEAMAGIINIITNDAASAAKLSADVSASTKQEYNIDVSGKLQAGKNITTLIGANYFNYQKVTDVNDDNFTDVTLQNRISVFNKWNLKRKNNLPFNFALRYLWEDRWGGDIRWTKQWRGSDSFYAESVLTNRVELLGNYGLPFGKEKILLEYSYNMHHQNAAYGATPYIATQHTGFAQLRWDKKIGKHDLLVGVPFRYFWLDDNTPATLSADGKKNQPFIDKQPAIFVQDEVKWSDELSVLFGGRFEYNNNCGNVFSPRVAIKYQPDKHNTFRFSAGNGYRNVNIFTEDHASLIGIRQLVIEGNLKPEKSWNGTVNYTGQFPVDWGFFGIDASGWYTYFTNKIIPDLSDVTKIVYANTNGYAVSTGISVNLDFTFKNGLKALLGCTYMDVYQKNEDSLSGKFQKINELFAPALSITYAISYTTKKHGLTFDLTGKVYGPQHLPIINADTANNILQDFRPEMSPWFTLMNLQVTKKINTRCDVYVAFKNLLNFMPKYPIMRTGDPFDKHLGEAVGPQPYNQAGYVFEPSYNYAPMQGIKMLAGCRFHIN